MNQMPKSLSNFIWYFTKAYKLEIFIFFGIALVYAFDVALQPYLLKLIIDLVTEHPNADNYLKLLMWPSLVFIIVVSLSMLMFRIWDYLYLKIFPEIRVNIIKKMVYYTHSHSYEFFQNHFAGSLANKITNDITSGVENIVQGLVYSLLPNTLALIAGLITLSLSHVYFGISLLFCSVICFLINIKLSIKVKAASIILAESKSKLMGAVVDSLSNSTNVKLFANKEFEIKYIDNYLINLTTNDRKFQWFNFYRNLTYGCISIFLTVILLGLLIYTKQINLITAGDFALVMSLSFSILSTAHVMAQDYLHLLKDIGTCKQALNIIAIPHTIIDKPNSPELLVNKGEIIFKDVTFKYKGPDNLFEKLSVIIPGGQKLGLVGYSGSGKTTFVNLITRLFDVNKGAILIDNQNIAKVTQNSLRKNISLIPQEPILFHRSLIENIRYSKINATDEEVIRAAKEAHAHDFIMKTSEKYNSLVGERGIKLSGGQRQRITIARAILKNAPILILDEATSSLDSITESLIQNSLDFLMQNKTVLVIAHRLSTLLTMDRILVFDKGKIIEEGTHNELLSLNGLYTTLWTSQIGGFLPINKA